MNSQVSINCSPSCNLCGERKYFILSVVDNKQNTVSICEECTDTLKQRFVQANLEALEQNGDLSVANMLNLFITNWHVPKAMY